MREMKKDVANLLLEIGAISVSVDKPFTYTSGLIGPVYCDNRKVLSHVKVREKIVNYFQEIIGKSNWTYDLFAGLATAGIPHAAFLADRFKLPMIYIRGKAKEHGKQNQIEGDYKKGDRILLVEDLINQAGSLKNAYDAAIEAELRPIGCIAIVDYQMEAAKEIMRQIKIPYTVLTDFEAIINLCIEKGFINKSHLSKLLEWQRNPKDWKI